MHPDNVYKNYQRIKVPIMEKEIEELFKYRLIQVAKELEGKRHKYLYLIKIMLSQFFIKLKNHQKSIQLWSSVAIINLLFFNRKSIFKFLKPFFEEVKTPPKSILTMGEIYIKQRQEEFLNYINNNDVMHINKNINKEFIIKMHIRKL